MAAISAIDPVRGWVPDWYLWARFSCRAHAPAAPAAPTAEGEPRPVHRKPTATEMIPTDVLLLKHNGELS